MAAWVQVYFIVSEGVVFKGRILRTELVEKTNEHTHLLNIYYIPDII